MPAKIITLGQLQFKLHWLVSLCVILSVSGFVRLGFWQLDRANEKLQLQTGFELKQKEGPSSIESLALAGLKTDAIKLQNTLVSIEGKYLNKRTLFVIYRAYKDQIGYEVITPFQLQSSDLIVLVSRGWVAARPYDDLKESLPVIEGTQQLTGQIFVTTEHLANKKNNLKEINWPLVIRYPNTLELSPFFESPLFPYVVRLSEDQAGVLLRHWPVVMVDIGRNQSYALQWFAMAIAVVIVSLILCSNILTIATKKSKPT